MKRTCLSLAALLVTACSGPLQGPHADLVTIATPDPLPQVHRPAPPPPAGLQPEQGYFRAWVPREVTPQGEEIDGHWITLSATPPVFASPEQSTPMPRAPKADVRRKVRTPQTGGSGTSTPQTPPGELTPAVPRHGMLPGLGGQ
jgi:hypothetical protein